MKCHFGNETYEPQSKLRNELTAASCTVECYCNEGSDDSSAKFTCAHIDCPEFFGSSYENEKPGKKCVRQYEEGSCCSTAEVCGEDLTKLATCEHAGHTYYEGERIQPDGSCHSCICAAGFNNNQTIEENPHCHKIDCNMNLHYQTKVEEGCIPTYLDE